MRSTARILFFILLLSFVVTVFQKPAYAQVPKPTPNPTPYVATTQDQSSNPANNFLTPDTDPNVPQNHHEYTQIVLIDVLSAVMCQLSGVDPVNPKQPCLGIDPTTGKIGMPPASSTQNIGDASQPQLGGALGLMTNYISALYVPAVNPSQYTNYLAANFGIAKPVIAAGPTANAGGQGGTGCSTTFGYGFCGLTQVFSLWTGMRDLAYAILTILFIVIGIGVMLRFRVDPRTVMTLQNQIPRVVVAILLITFSYAIAGIMIDLMWTATYAGINFISNAAPDSTVCLGDNQPKPEPLSHEVEQRLNDDPLSYTNTVFRGPNRGNPKAPNCDKEGFDNGLLSLSSNVAASFGDLVKQVVADLLGLNLTPGCDLNPFNLNLTGCVQLFFVWLTEQIVKLIVIIALLIALFRLWFKLITCYITFLIFVIMGPLWIVFGLIPGRPLGFEKWIRIVFANLAVFPLVAFMLVFARIIVDSGAQNIPGQAVLDPQHVFIPPLIGNPSVATFTTFLGFGAIMMAPTVPDLIKERMKATGQGKYGATVAAGLGVAATAFASPGKKAWEGMNRVNATTGQAEGSIAVMRQRVWQKTPFGRAAVSRRKAVHDVGSDSPHYRTARKWYRRNSDSKAGDYSDRKSKGTL
ncbi:MAG TPA: hypothetical protein VLF93_03555 [Candidatus Saccharimonadales bacterium]|nr:hypothetical protein [Candidatus Saccharimonadales bacterium]